MFLSRLASSRRVVVLLLVLIAVATTSTSTADAAAIAPAATSASSRSTTAAGGLDQVVAGMAAAGCDELTTACLLTSRSVTQGERQAVSQQLLGQEQQEGGQASAAAMGSAERALAVTQPQTIADVVSGTVASGGNLIFWPSAVDLQRGEGLLESLAPAMEVILQQGLSESASLVIVAEDAKATVTKQLQGSLERVLTNLGAVHGKTLYTLEDVFATVTYVTPATACETLVKEGRKASASAAASRIAIASKTAATMASRHHSSGSSSNNNMLAAADLAAARTLGPVARRVAADARQTVQAQCRDENGLEPRRVVDFGELVEAAWQAAATEMRQAAKALPSSSTATRIVRDMQDQWIGQLSADFEQQVDLLAEETFQTFRKNLSKLIIGPNLAADMAQVTKTSVASFARQARRLVAPSASGTWSTAAAQAALQMRLQETVVSRLTNARAQGKFRPLPRKGITIGLHWLLPKPFGNDYRQEPWMVHASDNLVYVPPDKVTQVDPSTVAAGEDWRNQIVPSPVGNDMVFMQ